MSKYIQVNFIDNYTSEIIYKIYVKAKKNKKQFKN